MTAIILMLLLFLPEAAMRPQPAGIDDKQPVPGDVLTFSMEPSQSKPGQMAAPLQVACGWCRGSPACFCVPELPEVAKNVEGSTGVKARLLSPASDRHDS